MDVEVYDEVAYCYDGTLEGLLSAIFAAYERHEDPTDVAAERLLQPRLGQRIAFIETDASHAERVHRGLCETCGRTAFDAVKKASLSSEATAGSAAYRFVRYAMDSHRQRDCARCRKRTSCAGAHGHAPCPRMSGRALSDITHPAVEPLFRIVRAVDNECERMRQFIRFEHLQDDQVNLWFARCNPRDSVVPLVMGHFVERFNMQPFIVYDEVHHVAGVYDGRGWYLVRTDGDSAPQLNLPPRAVEESLAQAAWKGFYHAVSVEARYNPELRRSFMPERLWRNITEMQDYPGRDLQLRRAGHAGR